MRRRGTVVGRPSATHRHGDQIERQERAQPTPFRHADRTIIALAHAASAHPFIAVLFASSGAVLPVLYLALPVQGSTFTGLLREIAPSPDP
jgi:hypothetical protein